MSAPKTNIEQQKSRHFGPLAGIAASVGVVAALFLGYLAFVADQGDRAGASETGVASQPEAPVN